MKALSLGALRRFWWKVSAPLEDARVLLPVGTRHRSLLAWVSAWFTVGLDGKRLLFHFPDCHRPLQGIGIFAVRTIPVVVSFRAIIMTLRKELEKPDLWVCVVRWRENLVRFGSSEKDATRTARRGDLLSSESLFSSGEFGPGGRWLLCYDCLSSRLLLLADALRSARGELVAGELKWENGNK